MATIKKMESWHQHLEIIKGRVEAGWNAKEEDIRSFELNTAFKMIEELATQINRVVDKEYEIAKKIREYAKEKAT